jgi:3-hydroxybutyryl-CoA dehydrogenase
MQQVTFPVVGIIGAGAMGRGIAQIAAQAGSVVKLFDTRSEAVVEAVQAISGQWSRLQEKRPNDHGGTCGKQVPPDRRQCPV